MQDNQSIAFGSGVNSLLQVGEGLLPVAELEVRRLHHKIEFSVKFHIKIF